ncbi:protein kinase domain-containing protein [Candidatus Uabimicrobium amorphum]|uniref:Serine/threonine-protein kinase PrkC n=1 Tax=Uabimicrobium amorphum TaxID=2596890 RepID=A0A5S9ITX6_UABAM|nr:protein kinase [Candidatus Uabimicrobium amorphum]BBM87884.1 serine/threonine-protein kinase PrkC [Candidatus Uabimicrobium amorphum]
MSTQERAEIVLKTIGNCELVGHIGKSKLGSVYVVQHKSLGLCVLKLFKDDISLTKKFLKSFRKNIDIINEVSHPSIASIYRFSEEPFPYMFREYAEGVSLEEAIKNGISPVQTTIWMEKLTLALQAVYNFNVAHKNLKPSNIFLNDENLTIVDFCLPASSSYYLSPEHCRGKRCTHRSDMYSLGIMFYETLTGNVPFRGKFRNVKKQHLEKTCPPIPGIPSEIDRILTKTLAKEKNERYDTLMDLLHDIRKARQVFTDNNELVKKNITFAMEQIVRDDEKDDRDEKEDHDISITMDHDEEQDDYLEDLENFKLDKLAKKSVSTLQDFAKIELGKQDEFLPGEKFSDETEFPEVISKSLEWITDTRQILENGKALEKFTLNFDKNHWDHIENYLQKIIRRECWIIERTEDEQVLQLVVDLETAKIFRYYNYFDDQINNGLKKLPKYSTIHKTFFTQITDSVDTKHSQSQSRTSLFSILDTIISLKDDGQPDMEESESSSEGGDEEVKIVEDDNWLNVDEQAGENIRKLSQRKQQDNEEQPEVETTTEIVVNFNNRYQAAAWLKLIRENNLEQGKHFELNKKIDEKLKRRFVINLLALQEYHKQQEGISNVKDFFQGDYHIERLDHGGMATVLKLTTKNDITIIFLRPENHWARDYFGEHLRIRKTKDGKEGVYAEMPKDHVVVVKVAFEGREEALIYESRLLSKLAEEKNIRQYIIGMIQEGSFLASSTDSNADQERVGYYLMMEYAAQGNIEQFSKRFPHNRLSPAVAFNVLYAMVLTLQFLKNRGIIHRDIKPQNILMSEEMVPKLGDFGLAITVDEAGSKLNEERRRLLKLVDKEFLHISTEKEQCESRLQKLQEKIKNLSYPRDGKTFESLSEQITELKSQLRKLVEQELQRADNLKQRYRPMTAEEIAVKGEFAGSMIYAAPEQFSPSKLLTCNCDIYQLAAVTYTMLTGKPPVQGKNISAIMSQIILSQKPKIVDEIKNVPVVDAISDLIYDMMNNDSEKRIAVDEVRKQLERILVKHFKELQQLPYYGTPPDLSDEEQKIWQDKVSYAQNAHKQSMMYIREWHLKIAEEHERLEKQKAEKEDIDVIQIWWDGNEIPTNFRFRCPKCSKNLKLPASVVGKKIRCPHCQSKLIAKRFHRE